MTLSAVAPLRDLPPASIPAMLSTLDAWSARCVSTLADLEAQIEGVKADARRRHDAAKRDRDDLERALAQDSRSSQPGEKGAAQGGSGDLFAQLNRRLGAGAASKRGNGGLDRDDSDDMDVDEDVDDGPEQRGSRSKKRGFANFGK